jgi:hypothetical protein
VTNATYIYSLRRGVCVLFLLSTHLSKIDASHHCYVNVCDENKIIIVSNFINNSKVVAK